MATTADIRNGAVILHKSKRMKVIEFQHVKPGKGGAFVRTKLKDIQSGKIIDETFNSGHKLEFIRVEARGMHCLRAETPSEVTETVQAALNMAYKSNQAVAVLLTQKLIGAKPF